ncbi:uncharacterized protein METZ01_LOCUS135137, partial [marine metagenome]
LYRWILLLIDKNRKSAQSRTPNEAIPVSIRRENIFLEGEK